MTLPDRFWDKVDKTDQCWNWVAALGSHCYGVFRRKEGTCLAHRLAYEDSRGPIPDGLQIDHLCRNRACVNPAHLEPVTNQENAQRGETGQHGFNSRKTHCSRGHPYDEENTYLNGNTRHCRECKRMHGRKYDKERTPRRRG